MSGTRARLRSEAEAGATLVELLVYSVLLLLVLVGVGTLLIQSIRGQQQVVGVSQSSGDAQVAMSAIDRAVRNAAVAGVEVSPHVLVTHSGGGDSAADFVCQAWVYVAPQAGASYGAIWTRSLPVSTTRAAGARLDALAATLVAGGPPAGWMRLVDGVLPQSGGTTGTVFSGPAPAVTTSFRAVQTSPATANEPGTQVSSTTTSRMQAVSGNGGCFS